MTLPDPHIATNVYGEPLVPCSFRPVTGYFRDGCCKTDDTDTGTHVICAIMTAEFLAFSESQGNDLTTPHPEWMFPGLKPGDQWCLCARRWQEAFYGGVAPPVVLESTNRKVLSMLPLATLEQYARTPDID